MDLYRNKRGIGDEGIYSNGYGSVLLLQCRTNTLKLRWRQRFEGVAVDCPLCGGGKETVQHFVIECGKLREIRERYRVCGAEALEEVLMFGGRSREKVEQAQQCKKMLEEMWKLRRRIGKLLRR